MRWPNIAKSIQDGQQALYLAEKFHSEAPQKFGQWLHREQPNLDGMSPWQMLRLSRGEKLLRVVERQLDEGSL